MNDLVSNVCHVKFTKKDGTIREMLITLQESIIPHSIESENPRKSNPDVVSVWSIEDKGWRSFRKDSVIEFLKVS